MKSTDELIKLLPHSENARKHLSNTLEVLIEIIRKNCSDDEIAQKVLQEFSDNGSPLVGLYWLEEFLLSNEFKIHHCKNLESD
jgi:hypothetical protein